MLQTAIILTGYASLVLAWWAFRRNDQRAALAILIASAFLLRLGPALDAQLHPWDERYHAVVAKNMIASPLRPMLYRHAELPHDDGDWTRARIWLHKPPFSMWCIALSLKVFGAEPWAVRVPSILFGCLAVGLLYHLARALFNPRVAFWSALLLAINGHLIELASGRTSTDHVDAVLMALVLAACAAAARMAMARSLRWAVIAGALTGLAFLTKSWPALIVLPVAACWPLPGGGARRWTLLAALGATCVIVAFPWWLHARFTFPEAWALARADAWAHFTDDIEGHARPWHYYLAQLPMMHGELAPLAVAVAIIAAVRDRNRSLLPLLLWLGLPLLLFSLARSKMPAYMAIAAPSVCMLVAFSLDRWLTKSSNGRWGIALICGSALLVALPLRFSIDRTAPFARHEKSMGLPSHVQAATPKDVVVGCPDPMDVMFRTAAAAAYGDELNDDALDGVVQRGFRIITFAKPRQPLESGPP